MYFYNAALGMADYMVEIRRRLHQMPELSFAEFLTAESLEAELHGMLLTPRRLIGTGIIADLKGGLPGPTVAIRADMDALPIQEETGAPYASRRPGVMHACGHDGHMAIALGAARMLAAHRTELPGSVRFLFQPGEETPPGGAAAMVVAGALDGVSAVLGLHQDSGLPVGQVAVRSGPFLASSDHLTIRLRCKGGGGSAPHRGVDGITLAAQGILAIQAMLSRRIDPLTPALISLGTIRGGVKENVLADHVTMTGIMRTMAAPVRERVLALVQESLEGVARGQEAVWEVEVQPGYPPVVNAPAVAAVVQAAAVAELGPQAVGEAPMLMAADDMAHFTGRVPGCYFLLGVGNVEMGITAPAHTARFDLDEAALPVGAAVLAGSAWRLLTGS